MSEWFQNILAVVLKVESCTALSFLICLHIACHFTFSPLNSFPETPEVTNCVSTHGSNEEDDEEEVSVEVFAVCSEEGKTELSASTVNDENEFNWLEGSIWTRPTTLANVTVDVEPWNTHSQNDEVNKKQAERRINKWGVVQEELDNWFVDMMNLQLIHKLHQRYVR